MDADLDGKLDAVDIEWSEQVTGATGTAPYTVAGRTLGANVSFGGATTRVPFVEDPAQFDTDATPQVSYDAGPGDLHDVAEGLGDTTADAPSVATETPLDKAAPILVVAKTADLSTPSVGTRPNGTIDAVLATFSEPISHSVDGLSPFSLNVAGRSEVNVEGDAGGGRPDALRAGRRGRVPGRRRDAERVGAGCGPVRRPHQGPCCRSRTRRA